MRNAAKAEQHLNDLERVIREGGHAGMVANSARSLVAEMWDPYRGVREDWPAIYNVWLLLGEIYRLESSWHGTLPYTGGTGRRQGILGDVFCFTCFGIWCELWEQPSLREMARQWVLLELGGVNGKIGPSGSLVDAFLVGKPAEGAAAEWVRIRKKFSRGGLLRPEVHNDSFPFDVLAPELAWCERAGQLAPPCSAIVRFPPISHEWEVFPMVERALTVLARTW